MKNTVKFVLLLALLVSCSSHTPRSEYKSFNDIQGELTEQKKSSEFISNHKDIPKFSHLKYKMAPGYLFHLSHPSDNRLKGQYRADFKGFLRLPYNVVVNVKGLSFKELRSKILKAYSKFFKRGVEKVNFKLIYKDYYVEVRGLVQKSGRYLVSQNESIDKVIDKAGGLKGDLNDSFYKASIRQQNKSYSINLNQYFQNDFYSNSFTWTGADTIFISEQDESDMGTSLPIVTVLGGVNAPGKVLYMKQANLFYYLSKTGGVIPNLAFEKAVIVRSAKDGIKKISFDLADIDSIPHIYPQDTIILQSDTRTTSDKLFDRSIQVLSIITSLLLIMAL